MAEDSYRNIIIGLLLIGLFAFLGLSFAFNMANTYGKDTTSFQQNTIDYSSLNSTLQQAQQNAENWRNIFENSNPVIFALEVSTIGIWGIAKTMFSFVISLFDLIFIQIFNNVLHIPPIVTGISITVLIIVAIFGLWRVLRSGS